VVTIAGLHGRVDKVNEDSTIDLETSPGSPIKIDNKRYQHRLEPGVEQPAVTTDKKISVQHITILSGPAPGFFYCLTIINYA